VARGSAFEEKWAGEITGERTGPNHTILTSGPYLNWRKLEDTIKKAGRREKARKRGGKPVKRVEWSAVKQVVAKR